MEFKRRILCLTFFIGLLLTVVSAEQPLPGMILLEGCESLDQADATYALTRSLGAEDFNENGCLIINAPNVTLTCAGHTISAFRNTIPAIYSNQPDTKITDCKIAMGTSNGYGILIEDAQRAFIADNTFSDTAFPLTVRRTTDSTFTQNTFTRSAHAIRLTQSDNNRIESTELTQQGAAIILESSNFNNLHDLTVHHCSSYGCIVLTNAAKNILTSSSFDNARYFVTTTGEGSSHNLFQNIHLDAETSRGVHLEGTNNRNNTCIDLSYGIGNDDVEPSNELIYAVFVEGTVHNTDNAPLAEVHIGGTDHTTFAPGTYAFTATTDSEGYFAPILIASLVNDGVKAQSLNYSLAVQKSGYTSLSEQRAFSKDTVLEYTLTAEESVSTPNQESIEEEIVNGRCRATWTCTEWSSCTNGLQTRSCTPSRPKCAPPLGEKPIESQTCAVPAPVEESAQTPGFISRITGAVIGANQASGGLVALAGLLGVVAAGYIAIGFIRAR